MQLKEGAENPQKLEDAFPQLFAWAKKIKEQLLLLISNDKLINNTCTKELKKVLTQGKELISDELWFRYLLRQNPEYQQSVIEKEDVSGRFILTLGEHTEIVLRQFAKYFDETFDHTFQGTGITKYWFIDILGGHDKKKPEALQAGEVGEHSEYTRPFIINMLSTLGYSDDLIALGIGLTCNNPIGKFLRGEISMEKTCRIIETGYMSMCGEIDYEIYFKLLMIYFMCDASAYTTDAYPNGSRFASLDHLFVFKDGIEFSLEYKAKIEELSQKWNEYMKTRIEKHKGKGIIWKKIEEWEITRHYNH